MEFKKWQKIGQFHNTRKSIAEIVDYKQSIGEEVELPLVQYRGKIKLDGTNAAIRVADGVVAAQSRSRIITTDDDNYGFAAFVEQCADWALALAKGGTEVSVYGEWCGLGIQKRCSVSKCERMFVVFALALDDVRNETCCTTRVTEPGEIRKLLGVLPTGVHVLDWHGAPVVVDFGCERSVDTAVDLLCDRVAAVEECDPWIERFFGVKGMGEGLVYYPQEVQRSASMPEDLDLMFKAKGDKHVNVRQPKPVLKDPEVVASIDAFVTKFVTELRMEQGLTELSLVSPTNKDTGTFLKWLGNDIRSESEDELVAASLTWSAVAKEVSRAGKLWFFKRVAR